MNNLTDLIAQMSDAWSCESEIRDFASMMSFSQANKARCDQFNQQIKAEQIENWIDSAMRQFRFIWEMSSLIRIFKDFWVVSRLHPQIHWNISKIATKMNLKDWLRMIKIKKSFAASVNTRNIRRLFSWWRSEKLDHIFFAVLINHQIPHIYVVAEEGEPVVRKWTFIFEFKSRRGALNSEDK